MTANPRARWPWLFAAAVALYVGHGVATSRPADAAKPALPIDCHLPSDPRWDFCNTRWEPACIAARDKFTSVACACSRECFRRTGGSR